MQCTVISTIMIFFSRYKKKGKIPKPLCEYWCCFWPVYLWNRCKYLISCRMQNTYFQAGLISFEITALPLSKLLILQPHGVYCLICKINLRIRNLENLWYRPSNECKMPSITSGRYHVFISSSYYYFIIMHSMELSVSWKAFWNGKMGVCDILSENINWDLMTGKIRDQQHRNGMYTDIALLGYSFSLMLILWEILESTTQDQKIQREFQWGSKK